jgi:hypothetical protein
MTVGNVQNNDLSSPIVDLSDYGIKIIVDTERYSSAVSSTCHTTKSGSKRIQSTQRNVAVNDTETSQPIHSASHLMTTNSIHVRSDDRNTHIDVA